MVPIDKLEVVNSRDRNMKLFDESVENLRTIGIKKHHGFRAQFADSAAQYPAGF